MLSHSQSAADALQASTQATLADSRRHKAVSGLLVSTWAISRVEWRNQTFCVALVSSTRHGRLGLFYCLSHGLAHSVGAPRISALQRQCMRLEGCAGVVVALV